MFYVMVSTQVGPKAYCNTRSGRNFKSEQAAIRHASKVKGWVEAHGKGLVWPLDLDKLREVMH